MSRSATGFKTTLAVLMLSGLAACSGESSADRAPVATDAGAEASQKAKKSAKAAQGDCDLIDFDALGAIFNNKIRFTKMSGHGERGAGCTVSIAEGQESQLLLQVESAAAFEARKDAYKDVKQRPAVVAASKEAILVNDAQLLAIDNRDRAISLAVQMFAFGTELPISKEEVGTGLEKLGGDILRKM